jgi:hypothetical protein
LPHVFQRNAGSPAPENRCANASPAPCPYGHFTQIRDAFISWFDAVAAPSTMFMTTFRVIILTIRNRVAKVAEQP